MRFDVCLLVDKCCQDCEVLVGNDVSNIDTARWQVKSPFERNVVTQFDAQVDSKHLSVDYLSRRPKPSLGC